MGYNPDIGVAATVSFLYAPRGRRFSMAPKVEVAVSVRQTVGITAMFARGYEQYMEFKVSYGHMLPVGTVVRVSKEVADKCHYPYRTHFGSHGYFMRPVHPNKMVRLGGLVFEGGPWHAQKIRRFSEYYWFEGVMATDSLPDRNGNLYAWISIDKVPEWAGEELAEILSQRQQRRLVYVSSSAFREDKLPPKGARIYVTFLSLEKPEYDPLGNILGYGNVLARKARIIPIKPKQPRLLEAIQMPGVEGLPTGVAAA